MSEENKNYNLENENEAPREETVYSSLEHLYDDGAGEYNGKNKKKKEPKKITLSAFIFSAISLVLVTVMLTWSVCLGVYRTKLIEITGGDTGFTDTSDIGKLDAIFKA